jgi:hypothetical protein
MAKFEDLGYCPYNEVVQNERKEWLQLNDEAKGRRKALWSLIGPYLVCANENSLGLNEPGKIFFGTKTLSDEVLIALVKRYNFKECAPIWIKRPKVDIAEYVLDITDKEPAIMISAFDVGKLVVISNGEKSELVLAYWDIVPDYIS